MLRGAGDLLQGRQKGGALCHPSQEDQPGEGYGGHQGAGNRADGADAGHAQKRLQTHRRHPGFPGLHASADAPALCNYPGEIYPLYKM